MKLNETPVTWREYYVKLRKDYTEKRDKIVEELNGLKKRLNDLYEVVKKDTESYKESYKINLYEYEEFVNNQYIDGKLLKVTKGVFINRKDDYTLVAEAHNAFQYASLQKRCYDLNKELNKCNTIIGLSIKDYCNILKDFYLEVHRQLIVEGNGYAFEGKLGWICINRCKVSKGMRPTIDFAATRKRKQELLAAGKTLYDEKDAAFCKEHGIPYDGVDWKVMRETPEAVYEVPLLGCTIKNGNDYELKPTTWVNYKIKKKTYEELISECDNDITKVCKLDVDIKKKISMCLKIDNTLAIKYIRNENQEPHNSRTSCWKDRQ